jgi:hypothetical protein
MLSFETRAMQRNAPSPSDRADRPENGIAGMQAQQNRGEHLAADASAYRLRGQFVARHSYTVPEELTARFDAEPAPASQFPRWYSVAIFVLLSSATLFAMCATGRPGA